VKYFSYLGSFMRNDVRCTLKTEPTTAMAKESFKKTTLSTSILEVNL
jgi:hypothetical protein